MQSDTVQIAEQLKAKWQPVLEHPDLPAIEDSYKKNVTAVLLENQEQHLNEVVNSGLATGSAGTVGGVDAFDPVLISLVRRAMPNLVAYDICGVQPMTGPTGLIFALKANYVHNAGSSRDAEALFNEASTLYGATLAAGNAGSTANASTDPFQAADAAGGPGTFNDHVSGMSTATAEGSSTFQEMAFSIEKTAVTAKSRALKAEYTTELAQDLKAVHGLDAETELANILSAEILAEINREVVRTVLSVAKLGAQQSDLASYTTGVLHSGCSGGVYNIINDSDGRWMAERYRGLLYQIEREANTIAKQTRRGKGNMVLCSSDVASALAMSGALDASPMGGGALNVDDTGNTMVGTLNGRMKVYIDPYATVDYCCVGYKGQSQYDAGLFYCPYVPLQMVRAVGENSFQPKVGFKTRYGLVANPFVTQSNGTPDGGTLTERRNQYYRIFRVDDIHGINANNSSG